MFRSKMVLASFSVFIGGCATLPMDIPINPAIPDTRSTPSKRGERTPLSLESVAPYKSRDSLTDHTVSRGGLDEVLKVAPTQ
jgi:hypothetical protein